MATKKLPAVTGEELPDAKTIVAQAPAKTPWTALIDLRSKSSLLAAIEERVSKIGEDYFRLGYLFNRAKSTGGLFFEYDGKRYEDLYVWAEAVCGLKKTSVKTLMQLNATYYDRTDRSDTEDCYYSGIMYERIDFGPSMDPHWQGYTQSALIEMLPMTGAERAKILPGTTVAAIREIKHPQQPKIEAPKPEPVVIEAQPVASQTSDQAVTSEKSAGNGGSQTSDRPRLVLKNPDERKKWLREYKTHCYLWLDIPALEIRIWRYDLTAAVSLIAIEYTYDERIAPSYQLIGKDENWAVHEHFQMSWVNMGYILEWLTTHKAELQ